MDRIKYRNQSSIERNKFNQVQNYRNPYKDQLLLYKQQNAELKMRLSKYNQIEFKIQNLLIRDDQLSNQVEVLRASYHQKIIQNQSLIKSLEIQKINKMEIQNSLRIELQSLSNQIIWIGKQRDQVRFDYQKILQQVKFKSNQESQHLKLQFINLQNEYEQKLQKISQKLKVKAIQNEQKEREFNATRLEIRQQIQGLSNRLQLSSSQINFLRLQIQKYKNNENELYNQNIRLKSMNENLLKQLQRNSFEANDIIMNLRDKLNRFQIEYNEQYKKTKILDNQLYEIQRHLKQLKIANDQLKQQNQKLLLQLNKKNQQLDKEIQNNREIRENNRRQIQLSNVKYLTLQQDYTRLKNQQMLIHQKSVELQNDNNSKTLQIKQLLYGIQRLQNKLAELQRQFANKFMYIQDRSKSLVKQNEGIRFELNSFKEKLNLKQRHIEQLELLLQKQQRLYVQRQKQLNQMKRYNQINNPYVIKKYEDELIRMAGVFEEQKRLMIEKWSNQKCRIRQVYQYELKDKEQMFKKKLKNLQQFKN